MPNKTLTRIAASLIAIATTTSAAEAFAASPARCHAVQAARVCATVPTLSLTVKQKARRASFKGQVGPHATTSLYRFVYTIDGVAQSTTWHRLGARQRLATATLSGLTSGTRYSVRFVVRTPRSTMRSHLRAFKLPTVSGSHPHHRGSGAGGNGTATNGTGGDGTGAGHGGKRGTTTPTSAASSGNPASGAGSGSGSASSSTPAPTAKISQQMYWGAQIGSQITGTAAPWDMGAVSAFTGLVGKAPSILPFNVPFAQCTDLTNTSCTMYAFPAAQMTTVRVYGAIPMLNWASQSIPISGPNDPGFSLQDVISGRYDAYITQFAQAAKAWGHPFFLRFDWEMNGNWFPWSEGANGNQPGQFVTAWRHVHDIFTAVGATNANWVWCPYSQTGGGASNFAEYYPGDNYVDWTALDGYNWGTAKPGYGPWQSFDHVFQSSYKAVVSLAPSKPMMIAEIGSSESGGSKADWISNMFGRIGASYPQIRALLWFDESADNDWPVDTSSSSLSAFSSGISNPEFATNSFANLGGNQVPVP